MSRMPTSAASCSTTCPSTTSKPPDPNATPEETAEAVSIGVTADGPVPGWRNRYRVPPYAGFTLYDKDECDDLSPRERAALKALLKRELETRQ
jgi:hypothetical protein